MQPPAMQHTKIRSIIFFQWWGNFVDVNDIVDIVIVEDYSQAYGRTVHAAKQYYAEPPLSRMCTQDDAGPSLTYLLPSSLGVGCQ